MMSTKPQRPQCTTPKCTRRQTGNNRDKCQACYQVYARAVRLGKTTWKELQEGGLVGPATVNAGPAVEHMASVLGIKSVVGRPKKQRRPEERNG